MGFAYIRALIKCTRCATWHVPGGSWDQLGANTPFDLFEMDVAIGRTWRLVAIADIGRPDKT